MPHISVGEAQAWLENTKLTLGELDAELESQVAALVLGQLAIKYDTSPWINAATTPKIVRSVIAMWYAGWTYDRAYSEDDSGDGNSYADRLRAMAGTLIAGMLSGALDLPEVEEDGAGGGGPSFFPTDASSAVTDPGTLRMDPSLGGPKFSMGVIW